MPSEEYTAVSSGALRLKGASNDSKVKKHKKKKKAPTDIAPSDPNAPTDKTSTEVSEASKSAELVKLDNDLQRRDEELDEDGSNAQQQTMTEAERHYYEMRKKRLNERLKKEGTKTHKERVEDLNRYLNKLSEHHDMPKIGPG